MLNLVLKNFEMPYERFSMIQGLQYDTILSELIRSNNKIMYSIFSYIQQTKLASFSYWNQIKPPLETAIYWVKHVARHRGALHLRSIAIDMPFYIYYNLDCYAVIIVSCILLLFIFMMLCKKLYSHFFKMSSAKKYKKS